MALWTVWLALGAGLIDSLYVALSQASHVVNLGPDALWAAPLVSLVWVGTPGLLLTFLAARFPGCIGHRTFVTVVAGFAWFAVILLPNWVHPATAIVLALGLAVQTSWLSAARVRAFESIVRRSTGWLALLVALIALVVLGDEWWSERSSVAGLPPAPSGRANVLVLLIDTGGASHFSLHGYGRRTTPELESLADEGVTFEQAIAPSSFTLPSLAAIFTGRYPNSLLPKRESPLDGTYPTLAEALTREGYATGAFFANVMFGHKRFGLDRGFTHYDVISRSLGELLLSQSVGRLFSLDNTLRRWSGYYDLLGRRRAEEVNELFLDWARSIDDRPFFAFLNYFDAHQPYLPPEEFAEMFDRGHPRQFDWMRRAHRAIWVPFGWQVSPADVLGELDAYDGTIAYVDQQIEQLLRELRRMGVLERTIVIVTSDHGEAFGEHGEAGHGRSLYQPEIHVPLLILYPAGVPAGLRVDPPVSLQDLPATVLDLLDIENRLRLPGRSLSRFWVAEAGGAPAAGPAVAQLWRYQRDGALEALRVGDTKYVRFDGGGRVEEELFDLASDPQERRNLVGTARGDRLLPDLRALLDSAVHAAEPAP